MTGEASGVLEAASVAGGSRMRNVVPSPSSEVTCMEPPADWMICCEMASPRPVPVSLVVKKGTKRFLRIFFEMPGPRSLTASSSQPSVSAPQRAERWRVELFSGLPNLELILVIGQYAQAWHLGRMEGGLTGTVRRWREILSEPRRPRVLPLPHPSWRNNGWLKREPWFEAERVLQDGVFYAANRLYGVTFTERPELRGWNDDTRVFEVRNEDGSVVGLFLLDLYTRDAKRGGAWMHELVTTASLLGQDTAIVCNDLNVPKPADGEPTLLTFDEVSTMFHEFGHALHGLFARAVYPSLAGTTPQRDFVEFPSQVNEMWMLWPDVLDHYAKHYQTGEPLDPALVARIRATETFNQGYLTSEYLAAALLDQAWHTLTPEEADAVSDVKDAFKK